MTVGRCFNLLSLILLLLHPSSLFYKSSTFFFPQEHRKCSKHFHLLSIVKNPLHYFSFLWQFWALDNLSIWVYVWKNWLLNPGGHNVETLCIESLTLRDVLKDSTNYCTPQSKFITLSSYFFRHEDHFPISGGRHRECHEVRECREVVEDTHNVVGLNLLNLNVPQS